MIPNIKVSPSLLDAFANVLTGRYNETSQRLLDKINKIADYQQTEAMYKGTALHQITQTGPSDCQIVRNSKKGYECYRYELYDFKKDVVDQITEDRRGFIYESRVEKFIDTNFGKVLLYGYTDDIGCGIVQDLKTTKQYHGDLSFFSAWQWKLYLYCSGAHTFNYIITDFENVYYETYEQYPDLENNLRTHVEKYCEFLHENIDKINLSLVTYE